jgi:hypothetical protein
LIALILIVDLRNLGSHHQSSFLDNNQDQRNQLHILRHNHPLQDNHLRYQHMNHPNNQFDPVQHMLHNQM